MKSALLLSTLVLVAGCARDPVAEAERSLKDEQANPGKYAVLYKVPLKKGQTRRQLEEACGRPDTVLSHEAFAKEYQRKPGTGNRDKKVMIYSPVKVPGAEGEPDSVRPRLAVTVRNEIVVGWERYDPAVGGTDQDSEQRARLEKAISPPDSDSRKK